MTTRHPRQLGFKAVFMILALLQTWAEPAQAKPRDSARVSAEVRKSRTKPRKAQLKVRRKPTRFQRALRRCNAYPAPRRARCRRRTLQRFRPLGASAVSRATPVPATDEPTVPEVSPWDLSVPVPSNPDLPAGNDIANMPQAQCYALLYEHGVNFEKLDTADAPQVEMPVRLLGPVGGVDIRGPQRDPSSVLDCRLVLALIAWAPTLRIAGIRLLEHFSIYRAQAIVAGTAKLSGHAMGRAIDLARMRFDDGTTLSVLEDWTSRRRGMPPCASYPRETEASRRWRSIVCEAARRNLFQVILTPHHDRAHANHVHLEVVPQVDWSYIR